jgi:hypothetical protein
MAPELSLAHPVLGQGAFELTAQAGCGRKRQRGPDADAHDRVAGGVDGSEAGRGRGVGQSQQSARQGRIETVGTITLEG